jgi:N-acetyl-anhydromuramyl-L-alanine amidase AmpD
LADPTNYGDRYRNDLNGRPMTQRPIIVLHETVSSASSAVNYFQTPHPRDEDQVSYHTLIARDGTVIYLVPPDKRAFGAGNSEFEGPNGTEAAQTNPRFPSSVNNFAYHVSLESPTDGYGNSDTHSGYSDAQYQSLTWLVSRTEVPGDRITTHKAVDRSGERKDPRSFNAERFLRLLGTYSRSPEIAIGCPTEQANNP